jgi:hypothetical protein
MISTGPLVYPRADGSIVFLGSKMLFDDESLLPLDLPNGWLIVPPDTIAVPGPDGPRPKDRGLHIIDPQGAGGSRVTRGGPDGHVLTH